MSEIADFLRARYTERRALADSIHRRDCESVPDILYPDRETGACDCGEPQVAIADLDMKLTLVDEHAQASLPNGVDLDECRVCGGMNEAWPCPTLRILAQPFAGHPDHQGEEWAP